MTEAQTYFISIGQSQSDAEQSQMFGKPCFKIHGKSFVCFFQDMMVFKLTEEAHPKALLFEGALLFDPSGKKRPMKEWVQLPFEHKDHWDLFAEEAKKYVFETNKTK